MSLSNLGSQLASLNNLKYSSSKRTSEDALIGRGANFDASQGHALLLPSSNKKAVPSILLTSREAADVPMVVLRENFERSMQSLELCRGDQIVSKLTIGSSHHSGNGNDQQERRLFTSAENSTIDDTIRDLLNQLSTHCCDSEGKHVSNHVLHILEYLLRAYQIHERRSTATWLITCLLPCHEAPFFRKLLQLIDLADVAATPYQFFRPHLRPSSASDARAVFVDRKVIVQQASKDDAIIVLVCELAQNAARVDAEERQTKLDNYSIRNGVSRVLSFSAVVLMEAFHEAGTLREQTVRAIVPFIASSCGACNAENNNENLQVCLEYRHFGYIVCASMSRRCTLSSQLKEVLTASVVKGSSILDKTLVANNEGDSLEALEIAVDALLTVLNVLLRGRRDRNDLKDWFSLSMTPSSESDRATVGCILPRKTHLLLCRHRLFSSALGSIVEKRESDFDLRSFIAGFIASSISLLDCCKEGDRCGVNILMILANQASLKDIWSTLSIPTIRLIILSYVERQNVSKQPKYVVENYKKAVLAIRKADRVGCDTGISGVLLEKANDIAFIRDASLILEKSSKTSTSTDLSILLPARVALEHSDPSIRKDAISRLVASIESLNYQWHDDPFDDNKVESLQSALMRRISEDSECDVVIAAVEALEHVLSVTPDAMPPASLTNILIESICKWGLFAVDLKSNAKILCSLVSLARFGTCSRDESEFAKLVLAVMSHLDTNCPNSFLQNSDAELLSIVSPYSSTTIARLFSLSDHNPKNIFALLAHDDKFISIMRKILNTTYLANPLVCMRQRLLFVTACSFALLQDEKKDNFIETKSLGTLSMIAVLRDLKDSVESQSLVDIVSTKLTLILENSSSSVMEHLVTKESVLVKFCSVESDHTYNGVCLPALNHIVTSFEGAIVPIIMRFAYGSSKDKIVSRLLTLASDIVTDKKVLPQGLVYSLAMLGSTKKHIRKQAIGYIKRVSDCKSKNKVDIALLEVYNSLDASFRSDIEMDGQNALPRFLMRSMKNVTEPSVFRSVLLSQSKKHLLDFSNLKDVHWSPVSILFDSMARAGEDFFPLNERWNLAANDIFQSLFIAKTATAKNMEELDLPNSAHRLLGNIALMLKGVKSNSSSTLSILSGPSSRGRSRSYSLGSDEKICLCPYPNEMTNSILEVLSSKYPMNMVLKEVLTTVFRSHTWLHHIYPKLDEKHRQQIAERLLFLRINANNEFVEEALLGLTLSGSDILHLLKYASAPAPLDADTFSKNNVYLIVITECIKVHLTRLSSDESIPTLIEVLLTELITLSTSRNGDNKNGNGIEYTRLSILQLLASLFEVFNDIETDRVRSSRKKAKKTPQNPDESLHSKCGKVIVDLLGAGSVVPLSSARGKEAAIALLSLLCSKSPNTTIPFLMTAILQVLKISTRHERKYQVSAYLQKSLKESLLALVPMFCLNAHLANLSFLDLLASILYDSKSSSDNTMVTDFYLHFLSALETTREKVDAPSSFIAAIIANETQNTKREICMDIDGEVPDEINKKHIGGILLKTVQQNIAVTSKLVGLTSTLIEYLALGKVEKRLTSPGNNNRLNSFSLSGEHVAAIAVYGSLSTKHASFDLDEKARQSIMVLIIEYLGLIRGNLLSSSARRIISNSSDECAALSLQLWKDLMQLHTDAMDSRSERIENMASEIEERFWDIVSRTIQESLDNIQRILPTPHFLVSITSLLQESGHVGLQRRALRLLADRTSEIEPHPSAEASLFLDVISDLTALLDTDSIPDSKSSSINAGYEIRRKFVLYQSVLTTIDQIVGNLCSQTESFHLTCEIYSTLLPVLEVTTTLTHTHANIMKDSDSHPSVHLVSTTALVAGTLISTLKARSLPVLPQLIQSLLLALKHVNLLTLERENHISTAILRHMQKSVLRCFITIIDVLPQFIGPYLRLILSSDACFSMSYRGKINDDPAFSTLVSKFDKTVSTRVPSRLLVPTACEIVSISLQDKIDAWSEAKAALGIIDQCISSAPRADIPSVILKVIGAMMSAYSFQGEEGRHELLHSANSVLLSLVMKLSEAQLRPLYARLREWRGDIKDTEISSIRRYSFWSMTSLLTRELKGIFLPCMSSVVGDLVGELELAAALLSVDTMKSKGGNKRRRLSSSTIDHDTVIRIKPIQPVLFSIENALKSDAHDGGDWIRANDSQRYQQILNPLSKLLLSIVPDSLSITCDKHSAKAWSPYEVLIQGNGATDYGSVSGCLIALATAAGNEQLWKPLNHAILNACGHESRSEVRRAGIHILLSIIRTLGEEYMVLLPDCLPVLSELLEDSEEDIAAMAKECIRIGEDLLGEELEL